MLQVVWNSSPPVVAAASPSHLSAKKHFLVYIERPLVVRRVPDHRMRPSHERRGATGLNALNY